MVYSGCIIMLGERLSEVDDLVLRVMESSFDGKKFIDFVGDRK